MNEWCVEGKAFVWRMIMMGKGEARDVTAQPAQLAASVDDTLLPAAFRSASGHQNRQQIMT